MMHEIVNRRTLMTPLEQFLLAVVARIVGGASWEAARQAFLEKLETDDADYREGLAPRRTLTEEVSAACQTLAQQRDALKLTATDPMWHLLQDATFQQDLADWLMTGDIDEGDVVKRRLFVAMRVALLARHVPVQQVDAQIIEIFNSIERSFFSNPVLAHWRHQRSLDYLRQQVAQLKSLAERAAGEYNLDAQLIAQARYCEVALAAWDIIDLSGLPEVDLHVVTQRLLLRQLYMPLRLRVVASANDRHQSMALQRAEVDRTTARLAAAGRATDMTQKAQDEVVETSVGRRLRSSPRIVVLGDPGGGKTTMLRWLATAYLLRLQGNIEVRDVPDTQDLPRRPWLPVLIRCRDLGVDDLCRSFRDFLLQHLQKTELRPEEAAAMLTVILARMARGEALLLIDGLDEIADSRVRMMFCQEIERTAARYPNAPIVVTSRIVGYRDMPYRMGAAFEHSVISELSRHDKVRFAERWVEVTESQETETERKRRSSDLVAALQSSDRIERLTSSPMLLTTLALVKRKVGKLPNRRTKLYSESVSVLLNWNSAYYEAVDELEAIPQLEYLAFDMCKRGVQRILESDVLDLFDKVREDYPNNRPVRSRDSQSFLKLLEARSSIIIKSGGAWHRLNAEPIWEFRHLTFQEYLAARALIDGRYPGRDRRAQLAHQVAPIVRETGVQQEEVDGEAKSRGLETWQEVFRLLVCDCKDEDVDEVLRSIANPDDVVKGEVASGRILVAMQCLAEEPNVSDRTAFEVMEAFCQAIPSDEYIVFQRRGGFEGVVLAMVATPWAEDLKKLLLRRYIDFGGTTRLNVTSLLLHLCREDIDLRKLSSADPCESISAALALHYGKIDANARVALLGMLSRSAAEVSAAAATLATERRPRYEEYSATPIAVRDGQLDSAEIECLGRAIRRHDVAKEDKYSLALILTYGGKDAAPTVGELLCDGSPEILEALVPTIPATIGKEGLQIVLGQLESSSYRSKMLSCYALGRIGCPEAIGPLLGFLQKEEDDGLISAALRGLGGLAAKEAVPVIVSLLSGFSSRNRRDAIGVLADIGGEEANSCLLTLSQEFDDETRVAAIEGLGELGDRANIPRLVALLDKGVAPGVTAVSLLKLGHPLERSTILGLLHNPESAVRGAIMDYMARQESEEIKLALSRDIDGLAPWIDPGEPVALVHLSKVSKVSGESIDAIRTKLEGLTSKFGLQVAPEERFELDE